MRIVVNHLTRMQPGYVCVAGIDESSGKHVRPVLQYGRLQTKLLAREGGPFGLASVVDLGPVTAIGSPPEIEDHVFDPARAKGQGVMTPTKFWKLLVASAHPTLRGIFGSDLKINGTKRQSMAVDIGRGSASLGCLSPKLQPDLHIAFEKVKVRLSDAGNHLVLGVTDLRLYEDDHETPRAKAVAAIDRRIRTGTKVILSVGLGRAWKKPGDTEERHFLQVNNLHLEDDPCWAG